MRSAVGTATEDPIVTAAQVAFSSRLKDSTDVSANTKHAQAIAKVWRGAVHDLNPDRFQTAAMVAPELDQKRRVLMNSRCPARMRVLSFTRTLWRSSCGIKGAQRSCQGSFSSQKRDAGDRFLDAPKPREYINYLA